MNQGPKGTNMTKIQVYDPALCCSSGICGVDVDWLKSQGIKASLAAESIF
ncbi:MAG: arsenic metallochaperone ArsD family protein [Pirellula sp.]|jgi:hypothetical protein|nr:arsenic metallochaperone ArsD family protein [Pirellula sp.]